jgi:hypothetical protein
MSKIFVPSKPSWKITILVDSNNQAGIAVEDMEMPLKVFPIVRRQMNQLQLAILLNSLVQNTLITTLKDAQTKKGLPDGTEESSSDGRIS